MTKVLLVTGSSQVGKSSLIRFLAPHSVAKTIAVGDGTGESVTQTV